MTTYICNLLLDAIETVAIAAADIEVKEATQDGWLVKVGPLDENPQVNGVNIMAFTNDPDDENGWFHETTRRWPPGYAEPGMIPLGPREIAGQGGDLAFYRRFTLQVKIHLTQFVAERSERDRLANLVMGSLENRICRDRRLRSVGPDSYGEQVLSDIPLARSQLIIGGESGVYDGKVWIEFKTVRTWGSSL